jgi:hypothetical protein
MSPYKYIFIIRNFGLLKVPEFAYVQYEYDFVLKYNILLVVLVRKT